jgi:hypothetical protein
MLYCNFLDRGTHRNSRNDGNKYRPQGSKHGGGHSDFGWIGTSVELPGCPAAIDDQVVTCDVGAGIRC